MEDIRYNHPLAEACGADRLRLCGNVPPGSSRVLRCLMDRCVGVCAGGGRGCQRVRWVSFAVWGCGAGALSSLRAAVSPWAHRRRALRVTPPPTHSPPARPPARPLNCTPLRSHDQLSEGCQALLFDVEARMGEMLDFNFPLKVCVWRGWLLGCWGGAGGWRAVGRWCPPAGARPPPLTLHRGTLACTTPDTIRRRAARRSSGTAGACPTAARACCAASRTLWAAPALAQGKATNDWACSQPTAAPATQSRRPGLHPAALPLAWHSLASPASLMTPRPIPCPPTPRSHFCPRPTPPLPTPSPPQLLHVHPCAGVARR